MKQGHSSCVGRGFWLLTALLVGGLLYIPGPSIAASPVSSPDASLTGAATSTPKSATPATGVPKAVVKERTYTFAPVPEGTEVRHDFVIENHGTAPLVIKDVKTG